MTKKQEKQEFDELCNYIFTEILRYNKEEKKFPRHLALRLRGMQYGDFIYKKGNENKPKIYSFKAIYYTFVYKKKDIISYIDRTEFKDERHMINSIMVIIDNSINDIIGAIKKKAENNKKLKEMEVVRKDEESKAKYKSKTKKTSKINKELW